MVISSFLSFTYPLPQSLFLTAVSVITPVSLVNAGLMEMKGKHMQYSKFFDFGSDQKSSFPAAAKKKMKFSSRTGMLVAYTPAFLAGAASLCLFPHDQEGFRFLLLVSALTIHFFKRIFEVLVVHKYSGWMEVEVAITISLNYFLTTASMTYAQHLTRGLPEPTTDLKYAGVAIFLVGISGNFYHHYLLSKLRGEGENEYKIPHGGLFGLVICPHYLFEILGFLGVSWISQSFYSFCVTLGTVGYLMGRSYATRKWYLSKFEDFPKGIKALIPYIF